MKIQAQSKPHTPRQIARLVAIGLTSSGWLTKTQQDEAMATDGGPSLLINVADPTGPNGMRSFMISVREVT